VALALVQAIEAAGGQPPLNTDEVKLSGQWWTYSSNKARRELGWKTGPHEDSLEATVSWYLERDEARFQMARRSQPVSYKLAAAALSGLDGAAGLARRLWPLAA
jgi:hypothetical protein